MSKDREKVLMEGYVLASGASIGYKASYKRFYFVLTDCLSYYETKESFDSGANCIGYLTMEAYSIQRIEVRGKFQLIINAYELCLYFYC